MFLNNQNNIIFQLHTIAYRSKYHVKIWRNDGSIKFILQIEKINKIIVKTISTRVTMLLLPAVLLNPPAVELFITEALLLLICLLRLADGSSSTSASE